MKRAYLALAAAIAAGFLAPALVLATGPATLSGTITRITGSGVVFSNSTAASYYADLGAATLTRKNGAAMKFSEILVGDKIQVTGTLWNDNSFTASAARDLSLYAHNSTFSGKITNINPSGLSFTLESKTNGDQIIYTNNFTSFSKNGKSATFGDLVLGMSATVKGQWDRSNTNVTAGSVAGSLRLIDIYFTGILFMKNGAALTVVGNGNVMYGVDVSQALLQNKSGKTLALGSFNLGDSLRVWGKHISGSVSVTGTQIKDSSVTK